MSAARPPDYAEAPPIGIYRPFSVSVLGSCRYNEYCECWLGLQHGYAGSLRVPAAFVNAGGEIKGGLVNVAFDPAALPFANRAEYVYWLAGYAPGETVAVLVDDDTNPSATWTGSPGGGYRVISADGFKADTVYTLVTAVARARGGSIYARAPLRLVRFESVPYRAVVVTAREAVDNGVSPFGSVEGTHMLAAWAPPGTTVEVGIDSPIASCVTGSDGSCYAQWDAPPVTNVLYKIHFVGDGVDVFTLAALVTANDVEPFWWRDSGEAGVSCTVDVAEGWARA